MAGLDKRGLNAMDHDNIPQHLIPSVSIKLEPPTDLSGDWYSGQPTVIFKDAIFQSSNAFRHVAEIIKNLTLADSSRPMMFFGTDGGPDHNVTSIQVILSYISLFLELDLDFLCAVRTPPNFSVLNPAERFMSTANMALIGVSLARNDLGKNEKIVRSLMSKQQWRSAQERHPEIDYKKLALDGTADARNLLESRFQSLKYKGSSVLVGEPADTDEIDELRKIITDRWPEIDFSKKLVKAEVFKIASFARFLETHVRHTTYAFQVKKCTSEYCEFHCAVRMPRDVFEDIMWMPTPEPLGDKFLSFEEVYGKEPTDQYVPSKAPSKRIDEIENPKAPFQLAYTRVRKIVRCTECKFPRLLYSQYSIEKDKKLMSRIDRYLEDKLYICGAVLEPFPEIFQKAKVSCHDPISLHYYQAGPSLPGYIAQCAKCLAKVPSAKTKILMCSNCLEQHPKPIKITEKRVKGRPKK